MTRASDWWILGTMLPRARFGAAAVVAAAVVVFLALPAVAGALPLVGHWQLDEGRGQVVRDLSGWGNNGVLGATSAVETSDPTWIRGVSGYALRFGGDQFVSVPSSASLEPANVTVLAWVRGATSPGMFRYVVSKGAIGCNNGSYGLYTGFSGGMAFYVYDGTTVDVSPAATAALWDGRWHAVEGTYDGKTVRLYVDGTEIGHGTTVPLPGPIAYGLPTSGDAQIGGYTGGCGLTFVGDIDEVSIWSAALPFGVGGSAVAAVR